MRKKERIKPFLKIIEKYWKKNPTLRFTQVCISLSIVPNTSGYWYYREDIEHFDYNHEFVREIFHWGSYGQKGKSKLKQISLKNMETDHIKSCLKTEKLEDNIKKYFKDELKYRRKNKCHK